MSEQIKQGLQKYLPYVSLISVFILFFYIGQWTAKAESKMFDSASQKELLIQHPGNIDIHMPYSEKVKVFVPRTEIEAMKSDVSEIKKDIKELIKSSKSN